jgi:hypothetical protein
MKKIERTYYLEQLLSARNNGLIKVITGIRRCGKSFLLFDLFKSRLLQEGVSASHILEIALDDLLNLEMRDPLRLLTYIRGRITDGDIYYILLDEVQMLDRFVDALNSLLHLPNVDVYVTGSNSKFLSSDVATEFRGRGYEIPVHPLSFAEFLSAFEGPKEEAWKEYCLYGGLPLVLNFKKPEEKVNYLQQLFRTVYLKDLIDRNRVKKSEGLETLVRVVASSIGAPCNPSKLANTFKSVAHEDLTADTIHSYLNYLQEAFVIEKADRYDIKGKKYIGTLSKYYFSDAGLRNAVLGFRQLEETHLMENVLYNELRLRGFRVDVGNIESRRRSPDGSLTRQQLEVDFVANKGSQRFYIQSALSIPDREKMAQESASLRLIPDSFKKVIVVKDAITPWHNEDGILIIGLYDFLLQTDAYLI